MANQKANLTASRKRIEVQLTQKRQQYDNIRNIKAAGDKSLASHYTSEDLDNLKQSIDSLEDEHDEARRQYEELKDGIAGRQDLLKLYENAGELLRLTYGMSLADEIIRIFFSNFVVEAHPNGPKGKQKQWSVRSHCLAEPFDKMFENGNFLVWSDFTNSLEPILAQNANSEPRRLSSGAGRASPAAPFAFF